MGRSITYPDNFFSQPFYELFRKEPHPRNRMRLLAMAHLQDGYSMQAVAKMVKVHWKTVQAWMQRFRKDSLSGLYESARSGAPRKISLEAEQWITDKINQLSTKLTGGMITGKALHDGELPVGMCDKRKNFF